MKSDRPKPIDIDAELGTLTFLHNRTRNTPLEEEDAAFANLGPFQNGEIFVGSFSGESPWERHPSGDELVHVLKGGAVLTVRMDDGPEEFDLSAGMLFVVPQGRWHRFYVEQSLTVMTITPPPTEHSNATDPVTDA